MQYTLKQRVLNIADAWIANCNDDICYNVERLLEPHCERNLRELYDRKIQLIKFRMAFRQNIQVGEHAYCKEILSDIINYIVEEDEVI
jgi:hypothetical protein